MSGIGAADSGDAMNVYFLNPLSKTKPESFLFSLKNVLCQKMGWQRDPAFSLAYDSENHFFLKNSDGVLWGYIFHDFPTKSGMTQLADEAERLSNTFRHPVHPYFFVPVPDGLEMPVSDESFSMKVHFFEYFFLQSSKEEAVGIREISFLKPCFFQEGENHGTGEKNRISNPLKLTREELSALVDLSLQLKRI